jgi:hypothetical protein
MFSDQEIWNQSHSKVIISKKATWSDATETDPIVSKPQLRHWLWSSCKFIYSYLFHFIKKEWELLLL